MNPNRNIPLRENADPTRQASAPAAGMNYCGPGSRPGPPTNQVDAACQQHDSCYNQGGLSAESDTSGLPSSQRQARAACDQQLCGSLKNINPQGALETFYKGIVGLKFECH